MDSCKKKWFRLLSAASLKPIKQGGAPWTTEEVRKYEREGTMQSPSLKPPTLLIIHSPTSRSNPFFSLPLFTTSFTHTLMYMHILHTNSCIMRIHIHTYIYNLMHTHKYHNRTSVFFISQKSGMRPIPESPYIISYTHHTHSHSFLFPIIFHRLSVFFVSLLSGMRLILVCRLGKALILGNS
jgi:hypothetical protein